MDNNKLKRILTFLISEQPIALFTITLIRLSNLISILEYFILLLFFSVIPSFSFFTFIKYPWDFKKERHVSFIINTVSFFLGLIVILLIKATRTAIFIALAYNITGIVLSAINLKGYKASGHASSIAGPSTTLTLIFGPKGGLLYLFLLPAAYLKITLKDHTLMQFITGVFIAVISTLFAYYIVGGIG
ncbi:hypothetical protein [Caldisericum exile]|uniref:Hypothetical membrane protein n=1 Tax=Caldisericum exile (strain DSM 21853 / NBRC 104410 / AZM16c01) TaxID=511051 RepID=A0A7U6GFM1_CALEA|nr:hypothetical protein [Caldisericum exile]BAL81431.1 hypothetical membrane protein [Caldisericum exile AZM16c01]